MNKLELSADKFSLVTILSLGFMVLGIGCASWAIFSIWAQPDYSINANLDSDRIFSTEHTVEGISEIPLVLTVPDKPLYSVYPEEGDNIGSLTIPALQLELPIIQGTGANELKKGVGHFAQSVLPGEEDNCVFSGHRETVFRQIGDLKIGDQLIVQTSAGTFIYEVSGTRIVHADDKTVIVPTDHAVLTLTTCYPFNTPGYFPDRYIVSADLIQSKLTL